MLRERISAFLGEILKVTLVCPPGGTGLHERVEGERGTIVVDVCYEKIRRFEQVN